MFIGAERTGHIAIDVKSLIESTVNDSPKNSLKSNTPLCSTKNTRDIS